MGSRRAAARRRARPRHRHAAERLPRRLRGAAEPLPPRQRAVRAQRRPARRTSRRRALLRARRARRAWAAERTGGLVDPTLIGALEAAGYAAQPPGARARRSREALADAPPRAPGAPATRRSAGAGSVDDARGDRAARPGLRFDTGGTGKGLAADLLAAAARRLRALGGRLRRRPARRRRRRRREPFEVEVEHPLTGERVHVLHAHRGGVATSGIDVRLWRARRRPPAHHLLDPATGEPAWTGLVGATALAPTALEAEALREGRAALGPGRRAPLAARATAA